MSTRAGDDVRTFDFGAHIHLTDDVPDAIRAFDEFVGPRHRTVEDCVRWFHEAGVDGAALSQPYFMGHGDVERTASANDALIEELEGHPQFVGLAAIPTGAGGKVAADEFERCLENGYGGGALETKSEGIELNDPAVDPIFDVADRTGAPLLVHPKLDESLHPDALDDAYRLNAIFGREAALAESIFKVIHDGVLERHPDLDLVYHHLGGNIASMLGRIHLQLDDGRWPGQENVKDFDEFKAQLEDRIYLDTSGFFGYSAPLRTTFEEIPTSQIVFGTDAPYEPRTVDEYGRFVAAVEESTSVTDSRGVLSGNAMDLLVV